MRSPPRRTISRRRARCSSARNISAAPVKYVLGGAGHIAGIINPPDKDKYQYWMGGPPVGSYDDWVKSATEIKGSWWPDWLAWLTAAGARGKSPRENPAAAS